MNGQSKDDFYGSETILYDTVTVICVTIYLSKLKTHGTHNTYSKL
jgi:hypothetical protein